MKNIYHFIAVRFGLSIITLLLISFIVFSLMELVPGNCAERYLSFKQSSGQNITFQDIAAEERRLGLDRPFLIRYSSWVLNAFQGDFGTSCIMRVDISTLLIPKFGMSLGICIVALILAYSLAIPFGIISATTKNKILDSSLKFFSYLGLALPNFLVALAVMLFSTIYFGDTLTGLFSPEYQDAPWSMKKFLNFLAHAWLPIFILGWAATALALQTVKALVIDENKKLYVTAAKARGVTGKRLLLNYPTRHALSPLINSIGFDLNRIFNDLPIVALILAITDAGSLLLQALVRSNDQQLAGAIIFLMTATIIIINFITDIVLSIIDPRARKGMLNQK